MRCIRHPLSQILLLLLGGVVSDRFERRVLLMLSYGIRGSAIAAIGVLSVTGKLELWHAIVLVAIYAAGVTQGLMWRAFDETGRLQYPDFVETVVRIIPMYWVRVLGGSLFVAGMVMGLVLEFGFRPAVDADKRRFLCKRHH